MTTVAVIQPYFFPYAGYFRLFSAADVVVMFDCVQFPRRGWVHRNRFALSDGELDWLTLPLAKAERDVRIDELRWAPDAAARLDANLRRFPLLESGRHSDVVRRMLDLAKPDVTAYLCERIAEVTATLGIAKPMVRSSTLAIDSALRAQDRVIAIVRALGGERYVNPSGGRELYDHEGFRSAGIELRFLSPYESGSESILARLLHEAPDHIAAEIQRETILSP
ncbi:MAG: WbqC family protein [Candidatus Aquilonibacter sp.]